MDPPLVPVRQAFLRRRRRVMRAAGVRVPLLLSGSFIVSSVAGGLLDLPETHLGGGGAGAPLGEAAGLLDLLLRLDPNLPDAGDLRGRRLRILESAASFLAGGGEEGGGLAAFKTAVGAEAAAEGGGEGGGAAVAGGTAGAEDGFGEFHGRGGGEAGGEADEELAGGGAATGAGGAEMGSVNVH